MHILKDPTVWTEATAVTDAQNAVNAYGSQLKAIYSQWAEPDTGVIPLLKSKGLTGKVMVVSDDGVPFEMCDVGKGTLDASQSQPADLYAYWALKYALDAAHGVQHSPGQPGGGAPQLQMVSYAGDSNLGDPIVAPFVTKGAQTLIVLRRKVRGRVNSSRMAIACSSSSCIDGFHRSSRPSRSSGPRPSCVGIEPASAGTGVGNPAPLEAGRRSTRICAR